MFLFIYLLCLGNGAFLGFYEAYDLNLLDTFALGGMFLRPSAVSLLFYVGFFSYSEWGARKQSPERKWILPSATTYTSYFW